MAAKEIYDYLPLKMPDSAVTLNVTPHEVLAERITVRQALHEMDDPSGDVVVTLDSTRVGYFTLRWRGLTEGDAGTLLDFYADSSKGDGLAKSFIWTHPSDGHGYVAKFTADFQRDIRASGRFDVFDVVLKAIGQYTGSSSSSSTSSSSSSSSSSLSSSSSSSTS